MRRGAPVVAGLALLLAAAPAASATEVDRGDFRYSRTLTANDGGTAVFEPDGRLFSHSADGFADLRIVDARGRQVPWRAAPAQRRSKAEHVTVLNSGRQGSDAVALLDFGAAAGVHDRLKLEVPDKDFVGQVVVSGSDSRQGPFTELSGTGIYGISRSAQPARSTVALLAPTDYRYLRLRASGVSHISGATVSGPGEQPANVYRKPRSVAERQQRTRTVIDLDLGTRKLPIDHLKIEPRDRDYERPVDVLGSNDGRHFELLASDRLFRFKGSRSAPVSLDGKHRYLKIKIENGDDDPLSGVRVIASADSRAIIVDGNRSGRYTALYGNRAAAAPDYDFARLPRSSLGLDGAVTARLGAEQVNHSYRPSAPAGQTRSFSARHPAVVTGALALAALALGAVGLLALRTKR